MLRQALTRLKGLWTTLGSLEGCKLNRYVLSLLFFLHVRRNIALLSIYSTQILSPCVRLSILGMNHSTLISNGGGIECSSILVYENITQATLNQLPAFCYFLRGGILSVRLQYYLRVSAYFSESRGLSGVKLRRGVDLVGRVGEPIWSSYLPCQYRWGPRHRRYRGKHFRIVISPGWS